jgi:hypothetical protein
MKKRNSNLKTNIKDKMKKIFSTLTMVTLIFAVFINNTAGAIDYINDQSCNANYPYTIESSESVFDNGSLGQTFVPTQNRLHILFLDLIINTADDESVMTVSITDFNEETILASSNFNITAALDGEMVLNVDFWNSDWQPYDVPLTPGDTYKIKLTTTSGSGNLRWAYKADANCTVGGAAIVGGVMDLTKDFGFGTSGYNYIAPVVVTPEEAPTVTPPASTTATTTTVNSPDSPSTLNATDTPTTNTVAETKDTALGDNLELLNATTAKDNTESTPSNNWFIIATVIGALILGILTFLQIKFRIISKIFQKKKKKITKK